MFKQILLKYAQITIKLHIILNMLVQQLASDNFWLENYILWQRSKINSTCDSYVKQQTKKESVFSKSFGDRKHMGLQ
jgi:hypothetical protein